ncbi:MAG: hypothetical protein AAFQ47_01100 [Pseudomonadota bacterium]
MNLLIVAKDNKLAPVLHAMKSAALDFTHKPFAPHRPLHIPRFAADNPTLPGGLAVKNLL